MGGTNKRLGRRRVNATLDEKIGALLRHRRGELGWSQQALAAKLGLTFQQVQKYEKGTNQLSVARLLQICQVMGAPTSYFLKPDAALPARNIDYEAARVVARLENQQVRSAFIRLAAACEGL